MSGWVELSLRKYYFLIEILDNKVITVTIICTVLPLSGGRCGENYIGVTTENIYLSLYINWGIMPN